MMPEFQRAGKDPAGNRRNRRGESRIMPKLLDQVRETTRRLRSASELRTRTSSVSASSSFSTTSAIPSTWARPRSLPSSTTWPSGATWRPRPRTRPWHVLFLYKVVLDRPLARLDDTLVPARTPERLPTVFSRAEAPHMLAQARWHRVACRQPALWLRTSADGIPSPPGQGPRLWEWQRGLEPLGMAKGSGTGMAKGSGTENKDS